MRPLATRRVRPSISPIQAAEASKEEAGDAWTASVVVSSVRGRGKPIRRIRDTHDQPGALVGGLGSPNKRPTVTIVQPHDLHQGMNVPSAATTVWGHARPVNRHT